MAWKMPHPMHDNVQFGQWPYVFISDRPQPMKRTHASSIYNLTHSPLYSLRGTPRRHNPGIASISGWGHVGLTWLWAQSTKTNTLDMEDDIVG